MHASRSELCFTLVWMLAKNVTVVTALKICSQFAGLRISICYVRSDLCRQYIYVLLACKQRVGDAVSVKTMVWRLPGLPDLFRRPCCLHGWSLHSTWFCSKK